MTARELLRVIRPGGRIAHTMHSRESFNGGTQPIAARYLPDAAPDPVDAFRWTDPAAVRSWFPDCAVQLRERAHVGAPVESLEHWWQDSAGNVPFMRYVRASLDDAAFAAFRDEILQLALRHADVAADGSIRRRSEYVIGVITRPE